MIRASAVLLAGGTGERMGKQLPKQYLLLGNRPIGLYSALVLAQLPEIESLTIVCAPDFQEIFQNGLPHVPIRFALPGRRRQDSLENGLSTLSCESLVLVHDAARPFVTAALIRKVLTIAQERGAAAAALPLQGTIRKGDIHQCSQETLDRSFLWEMQTPQVAPLSWLKKGLTIAKERQKTVTDELELLEMAQFPSYLVVGEEKNLKITTPVDLSLAEYWLFSCNDIN